MIDYKTLTLDDLLDVRDNVNNIISKKRASKDATTTRRRRVKHEGVDYVAIRLLDVDDLLYIREKLNNAIALRRSKGEKQVRIPVKVDPVDAIIGTMFGTFKAKSYDKATGKVAIVCEVCGTSKHHTINALNKRKSSYYVCGCQKSGVSCDGCKHDVTNEEFLSGMICKIKPKCNKTGRCISFKKRLMGE